MQKHKSNIEFSNTRPCMNPIPEIWYTVGMLLLSEHVLYNLGYCFLYKRLQPEGGLAFNGSVQPHFS